VLHHGEADLVDRIGACLSLGEERRRQPWTSLRRPPGSDRRQTRVWLLSDRFMRPTAAPRISARSVGPPTYDTPAGAARSFVPSRSTRRLACGRTAAS